MKPFNLKQILFASTWLAATQSYAGEASLAWGDPAHYTDIKPGISTPKATLTSMQKAFTQAFEASVAQLPSGYVFNAEITNVDLAGRVNPPQVTNSNLTQTRVLTNHYFPAITLNYMLTDAKGAVLLTSRNAIIKDMDYLSGTNSAAKTTPYYYETRMIKNWFAETIIAKVK